jgi:phosphoglycerate dehydrogenase-like enzyme
MRLIIYDPAYAYFEPLLKKLVDTQWEIEGEWGDDTWLRQELRGADAILTSNFRPEWRSLARHLKAVFIPGAGVPHSDTEDLPLGCHLSNVFEHGPPIAEYVFYVMLRHLTRIEEHASAFRQGNWSGSARTAGQVHQELYGKTISLLGYGTIGKAIATRAEAFGMKVLTKRTTHEDPGFYTKCDFLVVSCPLTEDTRRLISSAQLESLKPGAMLINVARGEIIDESALYTALSSRDLHAALDAWYQYPTDIGQTLNGSRLPFHELPNVLVTPHLSAWTNKMIERRMTRIATNLDRLAKGEALERIVLTGTWEA